MREPPNLVLASSSPRRREILTRLGLEFEVHVPEVAEDHRSGEPPADYALRVARDKAYAIARTLAERSQCPWILGADTVVVVNGTTPLGKPADDDDARRMLAQLSGREHQVMTGWVVYRDEPPAELSGVEVTRVWFKRLRERERDAYVATGEGRDKAGAYAIQGIGCFLIERIAGNYENVVGLPAAPIVEALQTLGVVSTFPVVEASRSCR